MTDIGAPSAPAPGEPDDDRFFRHLGPREVAEAMGIGRERRGLTMAQVASHAVTIPGRIDVAQWYGRTAPQQEWLVEGILPKRAVVMLSGDGGLGKSLLALQLQYACAVAKPWLGRTARLCKSVALYCEDEEDVIWHRLEAIARRHEGNAVDIVGFAEIYSRVGLDNLLMTWPTQYEQGETTDLFVRLSNMVIDSGAELIVLDSLHDLFGGNENARGHARQFIGELRGLALHANACVLLTAHPSLTGRATGTGESGSTAWNNAVRQRLYLSEPKQEEGDEGPSDYRELAVRKANYTATGDRIRLRWQDGVFVPEDAPGVGGGIVASLERSRLDKFFLACLDATLAQDRVVSDSRNAGNYAPKLFAGMPQAQGAKAPDLARAMERLFAAGTIRIGTCGFTSSRHPRASIVRASAQPKDGEAAE